MINTIIIPDVHGRTFWKDALPYIKQGIPTIFLGDYVDPYPFESATGWNGDEVVENFKEIIEVAKQHKNVTLLLGNHDLEYWDDRFPACRYMYEQADVIKTLFDDNMELFKIAHISNDIVYSHAGISEEWLVYLDLDGCEERDVICYLNSKLMEMDDDVLKALMMIGRSRGGIHPTPSMVWADISDWNTLYSFTDRKQIVGHSLQLTKQSTDGGFVWANGGKVETLHGVTCVDNREVWCIEDGNLKRLSELG